MSPFAPHSLLRWLASFASPQTLEKRSSKHHPTLEVVLTRGRKILDGAHVNYSFGGLHEVFVDAFRELELEKRTLRSALVLGFGGGSVVEILRSDYRFEGPITAVELDPDVVAIARRHFGADRLRDVEIVIADAREYVRRDERAYDLLVVDVFFEAEVPEGLRTRESLECLERRLAPGGLFVFNQVATTRSLRESSEAFVKLAKTLMPGSRTIHTHGNVLVAWEKPFVGPRVLPSADR